MSRNDEALEARARRAARKMGLVARKSRWRVHTTDNFGGFRVIYPNFNIVIGGDRFDLSAEDVLIICKEWAA